MRQDDTENHVGFMDSVLGKAKKVLFPEAIDIDVGSDTAPSSIANPNERRRAKSRAKLASSTSMLANISSDVTETNSSVALNVRAHAVCEGKENKAPKTGKRGNKIKLDSLAMEFSIKADIQTEILVGVNVEHRKHVSKGETRKSKGKGLSYAMFDVNANNEHRQPHTMRDDSVNTLIGKSGSNSTPSAITLWNDGIRNKSDIDTPLNPTKTMSGKDRRRGIVNNTVSLKERNESSKEKNKRYLGTSSLMMLPSSTQKAPSLSSATMHGRNPVSTRIPRDKICAGNRLPPSINPPPLENMKSATITGAIDTLHVVEGEATCSTPHSIRHRNRLGSIRSPPGFLCRLSIPNPNFFLDHSPLPESNLTKRFDGKKTPDNKSGALSSLAPEVTSPLSPEATVSFSPVLPDDDGYNATMNSIQIDEDHVCNNRPSPNMFPTISCRQEHDKLIRTESATTIETASPYSTKQVSEVEKNNHREECAAMSEECLLNVASLHDLNTTTRAKNKPTKPVNQTRPRVPKKECEASTEVRRSSRNSKPTDRLTVKTWKNKAKPVRSDNTGLKDEVNTKREKSIVRSGKKVPVEKVKKVNGDDDIEDSADWESYQSYIQSLLLRKRQG